MLSVHWPWSMFSMNRSKTLVFVSKPVFHHQDIPFLFLPLTHIHEVNNQGSEWSVWFWYMTYEGYETFSIVVLGTYVTVCQPVINYLGQMR